MYNIQTNPNSIKITVLGNGVVGKTSLIYRFLNYEWPEDHDPTIEDSYKSNLKIEDEDYEVKILDTSGEPNYQNLMAQWVSFGEGFLLVFAINDAESFEKVKGKRDRILKGKHGIKCPIILVGNKHDLENERKVAFDDAKKLADSWGAEYIETSAKTNFNCKEAFERLSQKILAAKNPPPKSSCPSSCLCNIM